MRLIYLCCLLLISVTTRAQTTFRLTSIPANTPANSTLYIAGSFNNWNPSASALNSIGNGQYEVTLPANVTGTIEFKFTRGSWATVEADAQYNDIANRRYTIGSGPATVSLTVANWKDLGGTTCQSTALQPQVRVMDASFAMPQLGRTRRIWVYLPADYATSQRRYPVLYLHDGQNVFDQCTSFSGEWGVDEALAQLQQQGLDATGCIVVAVDNGGASRLNEYSPWNNPQYGGGQGDQYVEFLTQTLKPHIDAQYRTLPGREHTGIAGSSMGALISVYAALKYPAVYSKVGVFSPAFWFAETQLKNYLHQHRATAALPTRFYFAAGTQESQSMVPLMQAVRDSLLRAGYAAADLNYQTHADGQHSEWYWRREFPAAYQWLFRPGGVTSVTRASNKLIFGLFPNPASSTITVQLPNGWREARLEIFDTTGRVVVRNSLRQPSTVVNVADLAKGIYNVRLRSGKAVVKQAFVKQ